MCKEQPLANHPTLYPLEHPLALSGQTPSSFIHVTALLHCLSSRSNIIYVVSLSSFSTRQLSTGSDFFSLSECFPFNLILRGTVVTSESVFFCGADEMGKDSFAVAVGVILRSGWNQKFCRFQLTRAHVKWLKPSISAPSEGSEILLHDS